MINFLRETHEEIPLLDFSASPFYNTSKGDLEYKENTFSQKMSKRCIQILLFVGSHVFSKEIAMHCKFLRALMHAEETITSYEKKKLLNVTPLPDNILLNARKTLFTQIKILNNVEKENKTLEDTTTVCNNLKPWRFRPASATHPAEKAEESSKEATSDFNRVSQNIYKINNLTLDVVKEISRTTEEDRQHVMTHTRLLRTEIRNYNHLSYFITHFKSLDSIKQLARDLFIVSENFHKEIKDLVNDSHS